MKDGIAVIGIACRYPDARTAGELWENVLAQRRAFRALPAERLDLRDYRAGDPACLDATYATEAAVLEDYEFDRQAFRVAGSAYRSADPAHWLALDVADQALRDAGFPGGEGLPLETTGVLVGNTLTGEFSRASTLRLRWPYVRRTVEARLEAEGWTHEQRSAFLQSLQSAYEAPFPPVGEETLAGGLSNTIAGRICNQFHLGGGGYTVDGACSASLLAVAQACSGLVAGDLDVALAGGVDLSLDPFELVGFAQAGALSHGDMWVYDEEATGFLPGEGCGFVVLMRHQDAVQRGLPCYAVIRGWGISSDGGGSIMRPEVEGQCRALHRAYRRAGYAPATVELFEGHGTGTAVGDQVELAALGQVVLDRTATGREGAALGSVKANVGHTKAAAGVAGLLKVVLAVHHQVLPPTTGLRRPQGALTAPDRRLRVLAQAEAWPQDRPLRAGVSSFGFGGINVHVTVEGTAVARRDGFAPGERALLASPQDAELFVLAGDDASLDRQVAALAAVAPGLSLAEMADAAAALARRDLRGPRRAAVVASRPRELAAGLARLAQLLSEGARVHLDRGAGVFLGQANEAPRLAFLFPGQASPATADGGALGRRFAAVREAYRRAALKAAPDSDRTDLTQPAVVAAEVAGLAFLRACGVEADRAVGHSLGELAALHWAGAMDERTLFRLAEARGALMAGVPGAPGAMASLAGGRAAAESLAQGLPLTLACFNSSRQTVVSGPREAVSVFVTRAAAGGTSARLLPTAHAFHSPLMAPARPGLERELAACVLRPVARPVVSTITGSLLDAREDVRPLLVQQLTAPVRFTEALAAIAESVDLCLEVGPGAILAGCAAETVATPVLSLEVGSPSLRPTLAALGAAFALGAPVRLAALFEDRFTRAFDPDRPRRFLANPCEAAPRATHAGDAERSPAAVPANVDAARADEPGSAAPVEAEADAAELVRTLVAERAELSRDAVRAESRLLQDLHLHSLAVAEIVATAARRLGLPPPASPLDFADATVGDVGAALSRMRSSGAAAPAAHAPVGVADWVRAFAVVPQSSPRPVAVVRGGPPGEWRVLGDAPSGVAEALRRRVAGWPGHGVVVLLPRGADLAGLVHAARALLAGPAPERGFVVLQEAAIAGGFVRTLRLEHPDVVTCVVQAPLEPRVADRLEQEWLRTLQHSEVGFEGERRWEPTLTTLAPDRSGALPCGAGDVLLASGGGKGITFELVRALARETGTKLAILARSRPEEDRELADNLRALGRDGIRFAYRAADVTDASAVRAAVAELQADLGPVTGLVHGAGLNTPVRLLQLEPEALRRTLAPKVLGLRHLLSAVGSRPLRLLVTLGSVIGRVGLRGEADYALANAQLTDDCLEYGRAHPESRCLAVESSVWSDVGMGERLGRVDALRADGIAPIAPGEATRVVLDLLRGGAIGVPVVVSGRLGLAPPLPLAGPELPLLRFVERPRLHYPGVELVVDADVSAASDPYLLDHVVEGRPLLPAVMGLEAMAQAACAVSGERAVPSFEDVSFDRPAFVGPAPVTLRLAALVVAPGQVRVSLRTSETGFQVEHFRVLCRFGAGAEPDTRRLPVGGSRLPLEPAKELYGGLLFQDGRFRRLGAYHHLTASHSCALVEAAPERAWFGAFLPDALLLGDAGARDAAIHSIQACIPHTVVLPVGVARIAAGALDAARPHFAHAQERGHEGGTYVYDLELRDEHGALCERWEGLRLRAARPHRPDAWPLPLLATHVEWRLRELAPGSHVLVGLEDEPADGAPSLRHDDAVRRELARGNAPGPTDPDLALSAAHSGPLTLVVATPERAGCDLELLPSRPRASWPHVLGPERWLLAQAVAREACESVEVAATRVWTALEALKKGASADQLALEACHSDGWVSFRAPDSTVATCAAPVRGPETLVLSVLLPELTCIATNTVTASASRTRTS